MRTYTLAEAQLFTARPRLEMRPDVWLRVRQQLRLRDIGTPLGVGAVLTWPGCPVFLVLGLPAPIRAVL